MNRRAFIVTTGISGILLARRASAVILPHRRKHHGTVPYILDENCEDVGTPTDWTNFGSVDWDETAVSPPEGAECVEVNINAAAAYVYYTFAVARSIISVFTAYRRSQAPSSTHRILWSLRSSGTDRCTVSMNNTALRITHGAVSADAAHSFTNNTWYYIWFDYSAGTGIDGLANLYVSDSQDKTVADTASVTLGTATTTVNELFLGYVTGLIAGNQHFYDKIRATATYGSIGSNPA